MGKDCPFIHSQKKNLVIIPQGKIWRKRVRKEKVTVAIVNLANHWPRTSSGKLLQFDASMSTHLKAEGNLVHMGRSKILMRGILALKSKLPSDKRSIRFSHQSLKKAKFKDKFPSLNVIQTSSRKGTPPNAPPFDQRSTEWNEEQEEFARQKTHKLHQGLFKTKGTTAMSTKQTSSDVTSPTKVKNTGTGLAIHSKDMVYMVDSGASVHMIGFSSTESQREEDCLTLKQNSGYSDHHFLWSQTRKQWSTSRSLALTYWTHLVKDAP